MNRGRFNEWWSDVLHNRQEVKRLKKEVEMWKQHVEKLNDTNFKLKETASKLGADVRRLMADNIVLQQRFEYAHAYNLAASHELGKLGGGFVECDSGGDFLHQDL